MKFHRIDIKNINSLYGDNPIDLDGHFSDTPLYLIMGPTGSGKTTILDAICLALFGTTPRQTGADGGAAGVGARVNSQGTGRSRAAVVFSLLDAEQGARTRYRAVWEFWRAHDRADGTPQTPRRELHKLDDDGEWQVLVSSTTGNEYNDAFNHVLEGMSLNDFLRSVMLAQGEFSALLEAENADKASILERLTDTGDYQKLGWLAHQRWQKEKKELERLDEQVENFDGATPDEIAATEQKLDAKKQDCRALGEWQDAAATRRKWLERFEQLSDELAEAKEAHKHAKAKREECAEDFTRRDADREASKARAPLDEVRRLEADQKELVESLPKLEETKTQRHEALEEARKKEKTAKEALDAAEKAFEELKPELKAAKEIKNDLKNAREKVDALDEKVEGQEEKLEKAQETFEKAGEKLEETQEAQKAAADKLEAIADDEALAQKTPALRAELDALHKADERVARASEKVDAIDEKLSEKSEEKEQLDKELADQKTALEPLQEAVEAAKKTLADQLGDAKRPRDRFEEIAEQAQKTTRRQDGLRELDKLLADYRKKRDKRDEFAEEHEKLATTSAKAKEAIEDLEERRDKTQAEIDELEEQVEQLGQNLLAAELRRTLAQGAACPVCGGEDHPRMQDYGADALDDQELADQQERDVLTAEVGELSRRLEEIAAELEAKSDEQNEHSKQLTRLTINREAIDEDLEILTEAVDEAAEKAGGLDVDLDESDEAVDRTLEAASAELDAELEEFEQQKKRISGAQDALEMAEETLEEAQEGIGDLQDQQKALRLTLENMRDNKKLAAQELVEVRADVDETRRSLSEKFEDAGLEVTHTEDDTPNFAAALKKAEERLEAYRKAEKAVEKADKALSAAEQALAKAKTHRDNAADNLESTEEDREAAQKRVAELKEKLEAKLDGKDPDEVEEHHEKLIEAARDKKERLGEERQEIEKAAQKAANDLTRANKRREGLGEDLEAARKRLQEAIDALEEMSSLEEVEAALIEEDEERDRLAERCDEIETALRDASRDIERLDEELEAHADQKPADFDPEAYSLATLEAAEEQLNEAIGTYNQKIGALETVLTQMRAKLENYRELLDERDAQQQEFDGWNELNGLIGVRSGESFKEFAQALNLDRIVARANRRLAELHPRYRLETKRDAGLPTLDFEIVDKYRSDQRRQLNTLSGGETFLVSLALALALADQQQIKMPIETLFLDEGFGTLDRNALRKAMDILNDLHVRGGRTVGVISHVEALQEQIPSQIRVVPQQPGRSSVVLSQD